MFTANRSIYERLKQRYGNSRGDGRLLFQVGEKKPSEKNSRDFEFIQYIVNFIIEQAKHNIIISELPDVIRTLHCQAEDILRKNRMITLQEVIAQVQIAGAMKYPYLKKVKPIFTEDFVREVIREVFDRLGNIMTLDMIENICRFTTCSAKQLLQAMPAIDVDEAAILIVEDISRNQRENSKQTDVLKKTIPLPSSSTKAMNRRKIDGKMEDTSGSISKERMRHTSSRSIQNSKQSPSKRTLSEYKDLSITKTRTPKASFTSHQLSKNINKNQSNDQVDLTEKQVLKLDESNSHFTQTIMENPFFSPPRHKSMDRPKSTNVLSSPFVPFDTCSTTEQTKNRRKKIRNPLTDLLPILNSHRVNQEKKQKIKLSRSKSNTQTYSIHSEEGLVARTRKPITTSALNMNDNAIVKPTRSLTKISQKPLKHIPSHTTSSNNIVPVSNGICNSIGRPFIIKTRYQSIHQYRKYCYQHSDIIDNEEQTTETDTENCPLENILHQRIVQKL